MEREITISEFRERLNRASEKEETLLAANIEITSFCNFRCPHCYMEGRTCRHMPFDTFSRVLDELKKLGCLYLTLTGGEAILHPQFSEIYLKAHKEGFIISVFSNGYSLDKVVNLFSKHKPYEVDITLYGIDDATYLENTGLAVGKKVFENIALLRKAGVTVSLKACVTKKILPHLERMREIAKKNSATFRMDPYVFLSPDHQNRVERLTPKEIANLLLKDQRYVELVGHDISNPQNYCKLPYNCKPGTSNVYITCQEKLKMCPFTSEEHSYDISNATIQQARIYLKSLNEICKNSLKCRDCDAFSVCKSCPERFCIETGEYNVPPQWMCETAQLIYKEIKNNIPSK